MLWLLVGGVIAFPLVWYVLLPIRFGAAVSTQRTVRVLVGDADTQQPLADVPVVVFHGPDPEHDTRQWEYIVDPNEDEGCKRFTTDEMGMVEFDWGFHASYGTNAFGKYGTIHDDSWIQISPPGYDAIVLPLDGQSAERRDYHDGNPVMITVLFRRAGDE